MINIYDSDESEDNCPNSRTQRETRFIAKLRQRAYLLCTFMERRRDSDAHSISLSFSSGASQAHPFSNISEPCCSCATLPRRKRCSREYFLLRAARTLDTLGRNKRIPEASTALLTTSNLRLLMTRCARGGVDRKENSLSTFISRRESTRLRVAFVRRWVCS